MGKELEEHQEAQPWRHIWMLTDEELLPQLWDAGPRPFFAWQERGTTQVRDDNLGKLASAEKVHNSSEAQQGVVCSIEGGEKHSLL